MRPPAGNAQVKRSKAQCALSSTLPDADIVVHLPDAGDRFGDLAGALAIVLGDGVAACHNLLAMEIAGLKGGKLYSGSWSEWSADPKRPQERG